jgi:hypothetical protein
MTSTVPETAIEITDEIPAVVVPAAQQPTAPQEPAQHPRQQTRQRPSSTKPAGDNTTTPTPVVGAESAPVSLGDYSREWADKVRTHWTPPELWATSRPPLQATWLWAIRGQHLPEQANVRLAARIGAIASIPFRALFLFLDWLFERWSRVLAAAVLILVVIQMIHPMF